MSDVVNKVLVKHNVLFDYGKELLVRRGIPEDDAAVTMDCLCDADLRGIDTHGVMRLAVYLKRLDLGIMAAENKIEVVKETNVFAVLEGGNYLGPVAATKAMNMAIEKAKTNTVGMALVRNSHHYGACVHYSLKPVKYDMIGFTACNAVAMMPPTGGKKKLISNCPFSFAAPAGKYDPFVIDIATSNVALGKIKLAQKNNQKIPFGWIVDKDGNPTDNPDDYDAGGMLLPIAGHKGYGMAMMLDILSGVLSGSDLFGSHLNSLQDYNTKEQLGTGHFMFALNINDIIEIESFKSRMDQVIEEIKACPKADGVAEIFVPGEIEFRTLAKRLNEGIPITKPIIDEINQLGQAVGMGEIEYTSI